MDVATGKQKKKLIGHHSRDTHGIFGGVTEVAFSPNGQTLASGSWDATICLWDVATGKQKKKLTGHTLGVSSVAFSPDGRTLASGCADSTDQIRLWDVATGKQKKTFAPHHTQDTLELSRGVTGVKFSPDGQTLASASYDSNIYLWDVKIGQHKATLAGHQDGKGIEIGSALYASARMVVHSRVTQVMVGQSTYGKIFLIYHSMRYELMIRIVMKGVQTVEIP